MKLITIAVIAFGLLNTSIAADLHSSTDDVAGTVLVGPDAKTLSEMDTEQLERLQRDAAVAAKEAARIAKLAAADAKACAKIHQDCAAELERRTWKYKLKEAKEYLYNTTASAKKTVGEKYVVVQRWIDTKTN